jgi:hypothetical protein
VAKDDIAGEQTEGTVNKGRPIGGFPCRKAKRKREEEEDACKKIREIYPP